ncbi:hypothetical protein HH214_17595 [Mucilaginibacter robiniae]|uniref:Beta-1,6-galactofuranosyltransferase n=1 Tax=Mucilaginibacter robiniae TaxID=2728022 RepID=A0A7L5E4M6_9SPHI|nr:hypothetical protein [Mucilaginibacter robiniae]QJD97558.1 hypothetical protein HH214_17595 [Mucilaginibacter robiniae]
MFKHKYQFTIFEYSDKINNSASTKAVADCNKIFTAAGYQDYTLTVNNEAGRKAKFYLNAFVAICKFLVKVEKGSLIGIQYPMLNNVFKYFIKAANLKGIKFFCIIHDVESLRLGGTDEALVAKEVNNLNYYDALVVHNPLMLQWLKSKGVTSKMVSLGIFDYLAKQAPLQQGTSTKLNTVAFAGNLNKSNFIYHLGDIQNCKFNVYGPNLIKENTLGSNTQWCGVYPPDEIVQHLKGDFGLIWDGDDINELDAILGNYLKFNNPHKVSLYLAAGLPVIAPRSSAIGQLLQKNKIGILIDTLKDLNTLNVPAEEYVILKNNCISIQQKLIKGEFFSEALNAVEKELAI